MRVTQKNGFMYLMHSWREKGRVITKEHYLGKEIPQDIEERKEHFLRACLKITFLKINQLKNKFRKEWKKYPPSIKKKMLVAWAVDFTYNTNAIEGSTITLEETDELIRRRFSPAKPIADVQETINHAKVFFHVLEEKRPLTVALFLEWHQQLFTDTKPDIAGRLREYSVRVGSYRTPDWQDVPTLLVDFLRWYQQHEKSIHPVELAGRAHYKFEKIHPFGDGNGRVGRLLITYILRKARFPLLIIEYKKRQRYYRALQKTEHDFVAYFVKEYHSLTL